MKKILSLLLLGCIKIVFADEYDVLQLNEQFQQNTLLRQVVAENITDWALYVQRAGQLRDPQDDDDICINNLREINYLNFIFKKFPNEGPAYKEFEKIHQDLCLKYNDTLLTKSLRDVNDAKLLEIEREKRIKMARKFQDP